MPNEVNIEEQGAGPARKFVERRYANKEIDWIWIRTALVKPTDVDCTGLDSDQLAERIATAKADGWTVL